MNSALRLLLTGCLSVSLLGCPQEPSDRAVTQTSSPPLQLRVQGTPSMPHSVGGHADLEIGFGPGEDPALFGALIADADTSQLTQWHVEPEGAAEVDPLVNRATFNRAGPVKIWATYNSDQGSFKSNELEIDVAEAPQ